LSAPATTLPSGFVSATRWNQPSLTSTPTGAVGTTSPVESAGENFNDGVGGALASPTEGAERFEQAAKAPGAITPTANAVKARRRLIDGIRSAGLTWIQGT
jgi:hypothetical protein